MLLGLIQVAVAGPDEGAVWTLTVDGASVGTRSITVRYEGETGTRTRIFEAYTELHGGVKKKEKWGYEQRLTANSSEGVPASFTSAMSIDGQPSEVQARFADGEWHVSVAQGADTHTYELRPNRVDLSTVDLFDPESDRKIAGLSNARILSAEIGKILEGPVVALGPSDVTIGGEALTVQGYEWQTELGPWRFWYAANGFLVRYEQPLLNKVVHAELQGQAPRGVDEFAVPAGPSVESVDL